MFSVHLGPPVDIAEDQNPEKVLLNAFCITLPAKPPSHANSAFCIRHAALIQSIASKQNAADRDTHKYTQSEYIRVTFR